MLDINGLTAEDKFVELQARTKGEAKSIVDDFIYLEDKESALNQALAELKFYFGKKIGSSQVNLARIVEGKEVIPNNSESVKGLLHEVRSMVALARATKDDSFLALDATVLSIVKKRFGAVMKRKFSGASAKAEDNGEPVNVDFLVSFLKDWYSSLNRTYGMGSLMEPKAMINSTPRCDSTTKFNSIVKLASQSSGGV